MSEKAIAVRAKYRADTEAGPERRRARVLLVAICVHPLLGIACKLVANDRAGAAVPGVGESAPALEETTQRRSLCEGGACLRNSEARA